VSGAPPVLILGVRRSGTTLLRVVLDRSAELAVPDESYFVPQLAERHGAAIDVDDFVDDLRRLPTLREWDVPVEEVRPRLRQGMPLGEAIAAVYETYAARRGKARWGDKTPMYMAHLPLLERLFPTALYVHLIRDGRDAATSFLSMPRGIVTEGWAHPRTPAGFACQWRTEVEAARALGRRAGTRYREVRYEDLVRAPAAVVERVCGFAGLAFEPSMLAYADEVDVSAKPHQQRLREAPRPGVRNWRSELSADDAAAFEAVAGALLAALGYETGPRPPAAARLRARAQLASYAARTAAWRAPGHGIRRSPLWRRRHPPLA
jgi:LPS sulfotransferase NodH